jgi:hypothetical protein
MNGFELVTRTQFCWLITTNTLYELVYMQFVQAVLSHPGLVHVRIWLFPFLTLLSSGTTRYDK